VTKGEPVSRRWLVLLAWSAILAFVAATMLLVTPAAAQNVLDAEPTVRNDSSEDAATRHVLPPVERAKNRAIIIKRDDKYFWASRGGRELVHHASGAFDYFIEPGGSGYVKVFDSHSMPTDLRPKGPRYQYMEHVTIMLYSITYWGSTDRLDLEPGR
jgi:hypothetical protein